MTVAALLILGLPWLPIAQSALASAPAVKSGDSWPTPRHSRKRRQAIRAEGEGGWIAQIEPTQTITQPVQGAAGRRRDDDSCTEIGPVSAAGRTYKAFSYIPEIGR